MAEKIYIKCSAQSVTIASRNVPRVISVKARRTFNLWDMSLASRSLFLRAAKLIRRRRIFCIKEDINRQWIVKSEWSYQAMCASFCLEGFKKVLILSTKFFTMPLSKSGLLKSVTDKYGVLIYKTFMLLSIYVSFYDDI